MKTLELHGIPKVNSGKVREMFEIDGALLMVATDRISAFDVILPNTVPHKGKILNQISEFWFDQTKHLVVNHLLTTRVPEYPPELQPFADDLAGRSMLVKKCRPLPVECVVRGYLAGSGWKEYRETRSICGIQLPPGLRESEELPEPIFTPSTKAATGHDENIGFEQVEALVGTRLATQARDLSLSVYNWARAYARQRGIIICDTKFEFGTLDDRLILIDEVLTPDSSRFWPADAYTPGRSQPSYDKQFIRDYLETLDWNKAYPGPNVPVDILEATSTRYIEAFRQLTGQEPQL